MFRFGKSSGKSRESEERDRQRAEETVDALERGEIPHYVRERILEQQNGEFPWTSDLSVSEWLLLKQFNLQPLGMVMGTSIFHLGYSMSNFRGSWGSGFIPPVESALLEGRNLALNRLKQEAQLMGAHAVVGVRLKTRLPDVNSYETEFTAFGTAVRLGDPDGSSPQSSGSYQLPKEPLLCTVSAIDFVKLLQADAIPVSLGIGVAAYYQYTSRQTQWQNRSWWNQEITTYTDAVYETRRRSMDHLQRQIEEVGGSGILAHETSFHVHEFEVERGENDERTDHLLEFIALGTIVSSNSFGGAHRQYPGIATTLSLSKSSKNTIIKV